MTQPPPSVLDLDLTKIMGLILDLDFPTAIRSDMFMPAPGRDKPKLRRSEMFIATRPRKDLQAPSERHIPSRTRGVELRRRRLTHHETAAPRPALAGPPPFSENNPDRRLVNPRLLKRFKIEKDTPIVPRGIATTVWEEASRWLDAALPRSWITELTERADAIYAHNPRFRQLLRRPGNAGRDWLRSFTRHWLAGLLWEHNPRLFQRLPRDYAAGHPLPPP